MQETLLLCLSEGSSTLTKLQAQYWCMSLPILPCYFPSAFGQRWAALSCLFWSETILTLKTSRYVWLQGSPSTRPTLQALFRDFCERGLGKYRAVVFAACDSTCEGHRDGSPAPRHVRQRGAPWLWGVMQSSPACTVSYRPIRPSHKRTVHCRSEVCKLTFTVGLLQAACTYQG